jgi:hypothetical protein
MVFKYENTVFIPKEWWSETNTKEQAEEITKTVDNLKVITGIINKVNTLAEMREEMSKVSTDDLNSVFEYGFGGSHFWLKQKVNGVVLDSRLFIVTEK